MVIFSTCLHNELMDQKQSMRCLNWHAIASQQETIADFYFVDFFFLYSILYFINENFSCSTYKSFIASMAIRVEKAQPHWHDSIARF